jgi:hypothetical protein
MTEQDDPKYAALGKALHDWWGTIDNTDGDAIIVEQLAHIMRTHEEDSS